MASEEKKNELMTRATELMNSGMELVDLFVNKNYLIALDKCEPIALDASQKSFSYLSLFEITKIVYDRDENINDKLVSVYSALSNFGSSALLVLFSDETGVKFYLGTRDTNQPNVAKAILQKSLKGNFPGIEIKEQVSSQIERLLENHIPDVYSNMAVTSVSIVPSPRDDDKEHFIQGLEKFIDSMSGEKYTAIFISSPLSKTELEAKKRGYEELYSALSQYSQVNLTFGENESEAIAKGISETFSTAINEGISDTTGTNSGSNRNVTRSHNHGSSFNFFSVGHDSGSGKATTTGTFEGENQSHTDTQSKTNTEAKGKTDTTTQTKGTTSTIALTRQNKTVQVLLSKIDEQLERIKNCESYGLWDSACYFIADNQETSIVAANTFKALVAGEKTSVENSFVNLWDNDYYNSEHSLTVMDYLRYGLHPRFRYIPQNGQSFSSQIVTPASLISGLELPVLMGFPHKSVNGVSSIISAEFGRNVFTSNGKKSYKNIDLGSIYHMGEVFPKNRVRLDLETLTSHCFITGSTGSGKSNTTYKIIDELTTSKNSVKFLVIEPAKGEYKLAFGSMPNINIFTTSPKFFSMLSINPFEFNEQVHVLEHLDRLIEIFSACWPLYAAMPALLKASFEQAYISHGWDLNHSIYIDRKNGKFPTFKDIVRILPVLLDKSDFSTQTKGDYVGSLVTRVESLTNGLLGQIFSEKAVEDKVLFDENTIVDLSRIGSAETKALLMGVLVLKLSEYRQSTSVGTDLPLKHVTILEEAHNLLKRTSTEQGQESANVQGKSVEMISNSIAEMRTYGEGFIIVDQSPSAVDISAIKNTNTKIIMRLPEFSDCEAVGHSIGLAEDQILELSKLDKGVAAIFQNNWLEAVLCKIDKCSDSYKSKSITVNDRKNQLQLIGDLLSELITQDEAKDFNMSWFSTILNGAKVPEYVKERCRALLFDYQQIWKTPEKNIGFSTLIAKLLNCGDLIRIFEDKLPPTIKKKQDIDKKYRQMCDEWVDCIYDNLDAYAEFFDKKTKDVSFMSVLLYTIATSSGKESARYKLILYCIT